MSEEMAVKEIGDRSDEPCMNGEPTPETAPGIADDPPSAEADNEASMTSQPSVSDDTKSDPGSSATDTVSGAAEATVNDASAPVDATDFKGFELTEADNSLLDYRRVLERLEEELACDVATLTPVRRVSAVASRRARRDRDPDGSRPSSALSVRSDGSALGSDAVSAPSSPAGGGRRRPNSEWASPLLRAPLEQGWRRELVYRATLDHHSRRNADIYYYTPAGKKLRSTREIAENLSGTGFTLENFSFFKEPLGIDDPEKEIIRDAKVIRRLESPLSPALAAAAAPVEGKRTPKPKMPKGASPPPSPALIAASDKIKVKSLGSRLSRSGSGGGGGTPAGGPRAEKRSAASDNNNTTPWKKARAPGPPPALQSRPPERLHRLQQEQWCGGAEGAAAVGGRRPCSMTCAGAAGAVPSLACAVCLCLYHPHCQGLPRDYSLPPARDFLCKNCGGGVPGPSLSPPPLVHKSGAGAPPPPPPPSTSPPHDHQARRVLLRMKQVSEGGGSGERIWAVARGPRPGRRVAPAPALAPPPQQATISPAPPVQSVALLNGRRFIVVQRSVAAPAPAPSRASHEERRRGGGTGAGGASGAIHTTNGAASPPAGAKRRGRPRLDDGDHFTSFYETSKLRGYDVAVQILQYVGMRELAQCARVSRLWRQLASAPALWRHVRMKNSQVNNWAGLCAALRRHGTRRLDLRKMLLPSNDADFWRQFAQHIASVDTLEKIELCRCPSSAVEAVCRGIPGLRALSATAVRDTRLDPTPLGGLTELRDLRLKSMAGLTLTSDLWPLVRLQHLQQLSLTSIKELGACACEVVGELSGLLSLELGECTFGAEFGATLSRLRRLQRLRLERGTADGAAPALLRTLARMPDLRQLELVNFDVKVGFDEALAECRNVQRLLIIPTYVSQSATTNKQVLSGVLRLRDSLTHLMWGVTIELLRVTELFIDQCEQGVDRRRADVGECIPVLKPVPGYRLGEEARTAGAGPPQVEILPLSALQRLLSAQLPGTRLKLLRIPFHATWRQSLADFQ